MEAATKITLLAELFFHLLNLGVLKKRSCINGVRSLLSICCMLLGYNFEPRQNKQEFGTAGSVIIIGLLRQDKTRFISLSSVYM